MNRWPLNTDHYPPQKLRFGNLEAKFLENKDNLTEGCIISLANRIGTGERLLLTTNCFLGIRDGKLEEARGNHLFVWIGYFLSTGEKIGKSEILVANFLQRMVAKWVFRFANAWSYRLQAWGGIGTIAVLAGGLLPLEWQLLADGKLDIRGRAIALELRF